MDNRTVLQKADLALGELTTGGGVLQAAQAKRFMQILIEESVIMPQSTVVPMKSPTQLIEKIRFGSRILRAGNEATALSVADRSKPDLSKTELNAKLFKAEVRLSNEVLEDSIEQGNLRNTIMGLMAERISTDMDDIIINSDTADATLALELQQLDGIIKQATSNVVDNTSQRLKRSTFKNSLKTMPDEFLRQKNRMRFFTSTDAEIDFRDSVADRATGLGDEKFRGDTPLVVFGVPIFDVPLFPENLGGANDETVMLLTDPKNINVGIWRNIKMETDKDISAGVVVIVATLRFDVKYAEETAVVKAINIKVG